MKKIKVTTFVGTRPEIIRLSMIIQKFDELFDHRLIHTGQNQDENLNQIFFDELGLRSPDLLLTGSHSSLGTFLSKLFIETEKELMEHKPDAILILGDTNSALCSIMAKRIGIPIYHLEAGNRSFDSNVPEEINRRLVDHISDINFPYSEIARSNLLLEGIHPRKIYLMGSPLTEVFNRYLPAIMRSRVLETLNLEKGQYFLVSAHRQENVDSELRLTNLILTLEHLAETYNLPVIVSTHPRTRARLNKLKLSKNKNILFHEPFGFFDYNFLQLNARVVLSDSGTISEESTILGFAAVTIRDSMERPEALESGSIIMSGLDKDQVIQAVTILETSTQTRTRPIEYSIDDSSIRVANVLISTVNQHRFWNGLRSIQD
jgi:UDP-N-acetylglucosamine 2-epimerase